MDIQWIREKATGTWKRIELIDSKVTPAYYDSFRKKFGDKGESVFIVHGIHQVDRTVNS